MSFQVVGKMFGKLLAIWLIGQFVNNEISNNGQCLARSATSDTVLPGATPIREALNAANGAMYQLMIRIQQSFNQLVAAATELANDGLLINVDRSTDDVSKLKKEHREGM